VALTADSYSDFSAQLSIVNFAFSCDSDFGLLTLDLRSFIGNKKIPLLVFLHPDAKNEGNIFTTPKLAERRRGLWEIFKSVNVVSIIFLFKTLSRGQCE